MRGSKNKRFFLLCIKNGKQYNSNSVSLCVSSAPTNVRSPRGHRDRAGTSPELFAHLFGHQGINLGAMIFVISQTLVDLGATQVWKAAADIIDAGSVED